MWVGIRKRLVRLAIKGFYALVYLYMASGGGGGFCGGGRTVHFINV